MARGDHLRASRFGYHHDGIDLGNGRVVHRAADTGGSKASAHIRISTLDEFAGDGDVSVRPYNGKHDPEATVARALSRVGEPGYDLVFDNCEHFARWCVTSDHRSDQVVAVTSAGATVGISLVAGNVGLSVVTSAGIVGNLSGAGLMSGLAAAGAVVGGGAIAGVVALGALPGLLSALVVNGYVLRDDEDLPAVERRARLAGRIGAVGGSVAGAAGSVWAIGALGVPGLSAAGISSGLAAIGGVVGGAMAAGTMLTIAAPAVGVALLGYLLYRLWMWLENLPLAEPMIALSLSAADS